MNRSIKHGTLAGTAALAGAMLAFAQNPSQNPGQNPPPQTPPGQTPDKPRTPGNPPASNRPDTPPGKPGTMNTPPYAQALSGMLTENAVQVFKDKNFMGEHAMVSNVADTHQTGTLNLLADTFDDDGSSLKWNLAPGTLVILFDGANGDGKQLALWGKGQIADLDSVDFENATSRWAWYDVGGVDRPRSAGNTALPHGAMALDTNIAKGTIHTYEDQKFAGDEHQTISVNATKTAGIWNTLPGDKENGLSSLRWNLPDGVVVLFSADDDGANNVVIFGEGQIADLSEIDFDNRVSRWTWAQIGGKGDMNAPDRDPGNGRSPSNPPPGTGNPRQPTNPREPSTPPSNPNTPPRQPTTPPSNPPSA